jgi:predicted esterase
MRLAVVIQLSACAPRGSSAPARSNAETQAVAPSPNQGSHAAEWSPGAPRASEKPESAAASGHAGEPGAATVEDSPSRGFELGLLKVPGFLDAVVALPVDRSLKPLVVATHGAGGTPEWTCEAWGRRLGGERVVLCPRGRAISLRENYGFYYADHRALEAEVLAAVAALKDSLAGRVTAAGTLYTGYSQGASMGSLGLVEHGADYPYLILTEGGFKEWSPQSARRYKLSGGERVLFVCGGRGCRDQAEKSARVLSAAGLTTRVEYVAHGGHTDDGAVGERLDATFQWALGRDTSNP